MKANGVELCLGDSVKGSRAEQVTFNCCTCKLR
jgi:hypothetical protein